MPDSRTEATRDEISGLEGTVESVLYHNEENGYTILRLNTGGAPGGPATVVGCLPSVTPGERITASGRWVTDRRYGRQFRADVLQAKAPGDTAGIEKFLGSGLIDGIGKEYARRIVDKFGDQVFDVIDHESRRLEEVEGIGPKRRRQIKESWQQQRAVRGIMVFLHGHGISTARALRIYKTYGESAVAVLRSDPYRLAREIPGVGFKTADEIAAKMGQPPNAPQRLKAGLEYTLQTAEGNGHCALPREELIREAGSLLSAAAEEVETALAAQVAGGRIIVEPAGTDTLCFLPDLREAEAGVARRVRELAGRPAELPEFDIEAALGWFEKNSALILGDEQKAAVAMAARSRFSVITGGPGVGKTTILKAVLKILTAKGVKTVLAAPTGRAAKRITESTGHAASTLHRLLEFQSDGRFLRTREKPLKGDLFVIDEASMIDLRLMYRLLDAIPDVGHVLLVGDVDQLPSVGAGTVLGDVIGSGRAPVSKLERIYRQAEASRIVTAAHAIKDGNMPDLGPGEAGNDFFFIERDSPGAIIETLLEVAGRRLPAGFGLDPLGDIQVLSPMNVNQLGTKNLNAALQKMLNPPTELKLEVERFGTVFRTGDKVIQTRNNYDHDVFNGDIGRIREITTEPVKIRVVFDDQREVEYEPGELDELQLAYAITIHKSQGSEFPAVVIPVSAQHYIMLQRNLIYTGVTRGKRVVVLIGEKKALAMAVKNQQSRHRHGGLRWRLGEHSSASGSG